MEEYLRIVDKVLTKGVLEPNKRTGERTLRTFGHEFRHDMSKGFPLLTTKKVFHRGTFAELEMFIKGITDKRWLQSKNVKIWNQWASPKVAPKDDKVAQANAYDLGPFYGFQWRHFNAPYVDCETDYTGQGIDQLGYIVNKLKEDPSDRRMVVSAWNPEQLELMALPPCHYSFQVSVIDNTLDLQWNQRSVDLMVGLPFNIASYGALLHLLAKEGGFNEGTLIGSLGDTHIYEKHISNARVQVERKPKPLPNLETLAFDSVFNWDHQDSFLSNYDPHPKLDFEITI